MTTNTVSTGISTQRTSRPCHYTLHRLSHISPSQKPEPKPAPPPIRPMENTVRILSSLAPQLNVSQAPVRKARSQSGRDTPSADIYSGILDSRHPSPQPSRSTTPYTFSLLEPSRHRRNTSSSALSHTSREHVRSPSAQPPKESTSFYDIAARALRVRRGHRTTSKSEVFTSGSRDDFDDRSSGSASSRRHLNVLGSSALSSASIFLNRPVSYHWDQDRPSSVIDISPTTPEKTKRKPRPPPLSLTGTSSSSISEGLSDGITPDSMITPASSDCPTARPWSTHSSPYATTPVSSNWPDPLSSDCDTTKGKIRLPLTSELFDSKKLPLLPPDDVPSPLASASVSGESLEPMNSIPPKMPFLPSNRRASVSLPGLSSNFITGAVPDDDHCEGKTGSSCNSSRDTLSFSERGAIMRKRRTSDPAPPLLDIRIRDDYTNLPQPKSLSPISLGLSFEHVERTGLEVASEELSCAVDEAHDPILRYTIHGTDVLDISRPRAKGLDGDVDDGASCVESHYHPTIDGMSDTESSCAASIYSTESELEPDLNSVVEDDLAEGSDIVLRPKRISEMVFRPASASSSDTFTQTTLSPVSIPTPSVSTTSRPTSLSPFIYAFEGTNWAGRYSNVQQGAGERRADTHLGQDWIGEWNEPNMQQVINKLRALKS